MENKQKPKEIPVALIGCIAASLAAVLGVCSTIILAVGAYLGIQKQVERPIQATQTAEALSIETPFVDGTPLPKGTAPSFSLSVQPGPFWLWVGLIESPIDRSQYTQSIAKDTISYPDDIYSRFAGIDIFPSTIQIIITGDSADHPTYISNRVPVRVLSYQSVPETVDLASMEIGGGDDVWLFSVDISRSLVNNPNQMAWASYPINLRELLSERWNQIKQDEELGIQSDDPLLRMPTEIIKYASGENRTLPDYFEIRENEMMVFSVANSFKEPGIYTVQLGIEYVYDGYKNIAWSEPPLSIFVPNNFYLWSVSESGATNNKSFLGAICTNNPGVGHSCEEVCNLTNEGVKCK